MRIARMLHAISLKRTEVVRVSELVPKRLEDLPVLLLALVSQLAIHVPHQMRDDAIVVQQRVVHVKQRDDGMHRRIMCAFGGRSSSARRTAHPAPGPRAPRRAPRAPRPAPRAPAPRAPRPAPRAPRPAPRIL